MAEFIQVIHPAYPGDEAEANASAEKFWRGVESDPSVVVIVQSLPFEGSVAVFSNYGAALEHATAMDSHAAMIIPKLIDEPSWGNTSVN